MPDRLKKFGEEEINRYTQEESSYSDKMFSDKQYQKYHRGWYIQRATDNTRIEVISFNCVYEKKHRYESDNNTPTWVFYDTCE